MVWNSLWPDGAKSVKQNTVPGQQNTTYTETTINNDHFWNIGTDEDGYHRKISMESYADTAIGAPVDAPIPAGMDAVYYLKPANGRIAGFYRNASGIYQSVPGFISGMHDVTVNSTNVVALPDNSYGTIFFFKTDNSGDAASGFFKTTSGRTQAYCYPYMQENDGTPVIPMKFGNGSQHSGLNLAVRTQDGNVGIGIYQYRITYWAT